MNETKDYDKDATCQRCGHKRSQHEFMGCLDNCSCERAEFRYFNREQIAEILRAITERMQH